MNIRFKELRKKFKFTQGEFGEILGITTSGVSDIESGRRNVTEQHIKLLCLKPIQGKYVNEEWLRTGEGAMFLQLPEEDEVAAYVSDLLEDDEENPLYTMIKEIMHTYNEVSPKSQEILREFSGKLLENLMQKKES